MKMISRPAWKAVTTLLVLGSVFQALAGEKLVKEQFDLQFGGHLILEVSGADVIIDSSDREQVTMEAKLKGRSSFLDDYEIKFETTPDMVKITGKRPKPFGFSSGSFNAKFTLTVPSRCNVTVRTSGGDIKIRDIEGQNNLKTSGGDMYLKNLEGDLNARTSGGDIVAENAHGHKTLSTSGGDLKVVQGEGDVEAKTSGGNIRLEGISGRVHAKTSGGNISIGLTGENRGVQARTSGGSIKLITDDSIKADLIARTSGGSVSCDLPITVNGKISKTRLSGKINGGRCEINLSTSGGNNQLANN